MSHNTISQYIPQPMNNVQGFVSLCIVYNNMCYIPAYPTKQMQPRALGLSHDCHGGNVVDTKTSLVDPNGNSMNSSSGRESMVLLLV